MISAIILACNVANTECRTFGTPRVMSSEQECNISLRDGIYQVESQGWIVRDYACYEWEERV